MRPRNTTPYTHRPVETDEHDVWKPDDHGHAVKGIIAGLCLSLPLWVLIAWVVGVI